MAIKITKEPDIEITQAAYERLLPEYRASQQMTVAPVSFETWLRHRQVRKAASIKRDQKQPRTIHDFM